MESLSSGVLTSVQFGPFITLRVGGLSMHLPGYGIPCAVAAREIAAALVKAADEVDAIVAKSQEPAIAGQEVS